MTITMSVVLFSLLIAATVISLALVFVFSGLKTQEEVRAEILARNLKGAKDALQRKTEECTALNSQVQTHEVLLKEKQDTIEQQRAACTYHAERAIAFATDILSIRKSRNTRQGARQYYNTYGPKTRTNKV